MNDGIIDLDEYRDGHDDEENIRALGLAGAHGSDLLHRPEPYNRVARACRERWHSGR